MKCINCGYEIENYRGTWGVTRATMELESYRKHPTVFAGCCLVNGIDHPHIPNLKQQSFNNLYGKLTDSN